eukprot:5566105-Pleurochrysis_carterae.AAC.1
MPPSPACATMSASCHSRSAATSRSARLSSCRLPGKRVPLEDLRTGSHRVGFAQSHITPRAHGCSASWPSTRVG